MGRYRPYSVRFQGKTGIADIQVGPSERILLAGLRQGVNLPYECGTGTCGECRAELLSGSVESLWSDAPAASKIKPNQILMCQSIPQDDVVLKHAGNIAGGRSQIDQSAPFHQRATITAVEMVDINTAVVKVSLQTPIAYNGGQFVLVSIPGIDGYRAYSFAGYPASDGLIKFIIRRKKPGVLTQWLFDQNEWNKEVEIFGPLGKAHYRGPTDGNLVLVMGGSGIAVGMSVLEHALAAKHFRDRCASLFFGVRTPDDAFFGRELESYVRVSNGRVDATIAFSEGEAGRAIKQDYPLLQFTTGFVHEAACAAVEQPTIDTTAFIAGPPPMVEAAIRGLIMNAKISPQRIKYDKFA